MNGKEALGRYSARISNWRTEHLDEKYKDLRNSPELKAIPDTLFPQSVVVIPDGNRRFAKSLGESKEEGHKKGAQKVVSLLRAFAELPISSVVVWGFSTDNWKREQEEIDYLMKLMDKTVTSLLPELMERDGRLIHLGRKDRIHDYLAHTLEHAEEKTKNNTGQIAGVAIDFGGTDQMKRVIENVAKQPELVEKPLEQLLDSHGLIKPADLLIRTGEEKNGLVHTSDIGWLNGKPTQIYPITKGFPELSRQDVAKAIRSFALTQRRQGV